MKDKELLELVKKAMDGDMDAFIQICEQKAKDILYICIRLMGNRHDAEDAAQEILLHLQHHIHELKSPEAFYVWLYRIINGTCIKMRRKNKKMMTTFEEEPLLEDRTEFLPQEFVEDEEKRKVLLDILDQLPHKQRTCMLMYYYERFSYKEIAECLAISEKEVSNALYQAKRKIHKKLEKMPETKKFLKKIYVVAPMPVLTQILSIDKELEVTGACVQQLFNSEAVAAAFASGGIGKMAAAKSGESVMAASMTTAGKVSLGLAITAGTAVIGTGAYMKGQQSEVQETPIIIVEEMEEQEEPAFSETVMGEVSAEEIPELPIETLEDMVGIEEAEVLRNYATAETVQRIDVEAVLGELGVEPESAETNWNPTTGEVCTMYVLVKQDKKLAILTKGVQEEENCQVTFRFLNIEEILPEDIELFIEFDEWREFQEEYE